MHIYPPFRIAGFGARYVLNKLDELVFIPAIESAVLPAAREPFDIILTEVVTPGLMYAHLPRVAPALAELSQAMNSHYRSANYPRTDVQEGQLYAALFAETNDWCRAVVKSFAPHDRVSVLYVDFGNMEMLTASQLRPLEERFRSLPFSALRCSLAYLKLGVRWSEEAIAFVKSTLLPFGSFTAKIARKKRELLFVDITHPGNPDTTVSQHLIDKNWARSWSGHHWKCSRSYFVFFTELRCAVRGRGRGCFCRKEKKWTSWKCSRRCFVFFTELSCYVGRGCFCHREKKTIENAQLPWAVSVRKLFCVFHWTVLQQRWTLLKVQQSDLIYS